MTKKILALGPSSSIHTFKWLEPLIDEYQIVLFSFHYKNENILNHKYSNVRIVNLPRLTNTKFDYLYVPIFFLIILLSQKYDLIISQYASSYGLLAYIFAPFHKKILIFWGSDYYKYKHSKFLTSIIRHISSQFDHVIFPSISMKNDFLNSIESSKKFSAFQYGISWNEMNKLAVNKLRNDRKITFLSIRVWEPLYNIHLIIEAFEKYSELFPNDLLKLTINSNSQYANQLKQKYSNHQNITFYDRLEYIDLLKLINESDISISIPKSDGMPLSVLETVSAGCLPILSNLPANREILRYCQGVLIETNSIENLIEGFKLARNQMEKFSPVINSGKIKEIADNNLSKIKLINICNQLLGRT